MKKSQVTMGFDANFMFIHDLDHDWGTPYFRKLQFIWLNSHVLLIYLDKFSCFANFKQYF